MTTTHKPDRCRTLVVPDLHGNMEMALGLMYEAGAYNEHERVAGWTTIQLGDAANCVRNSVADDLRTLRRAPALFDVCLVGNHEHPYWNGPPFAGYHYDVQIENVLRELDVQAAYAVDDILITHAGIGITGEWETKTAEEIATALNFAWKINPRALPFSAIGWSRGGRDRFGGVLWADWSEPKARHLKQIVGHTVGREVRRQDFENGWAMCIDLGGGKHGDTICGAVIDNGEVELVYYTAPKAKPPRR